MGSIGSLHVDLLAASKRADAVAISLDDSFFSSLEQEELTGGKLTATFRVREQAGDYFAVTMTVQGEVSTLCDRCLDTVSFPVDADDQFLVYFGGGEPDNDEAYVLEGPSNVFDLSWRVYETVLLSLPLQRVHPIEECNPEMLRRLSGADDEGGDQQDN